MDSIVEFANMFGERDNPDIPDFITATVSSVAPLHIRVNEKITFRSHKLIVPTRLVGLLSIGDQVVLFPTQDYKRAFVADKVVLPT